MKIEGKVLEDLLPPELDNLVGGQNTNIGKTKNCDRKFPNTAMSTDK